MKMIKNILFEVLPIASYIFFPPVWQLHYQLGPSIGKFRFHTYRPDIDVPIQKSEVYLIFR